MPADDALHRRLSLAAQAQDSGWSPAARVPTVVPPAVPERVAVALLAWAEVDDGALLLLDRGPAGRTTVRWVNRAGAGMLGYAPEELHGQPLERALRSPFSAAPSDGRHEPLVDARRVVRRAVSVERRDGAPLRVRLTSLPLPDDAAPGWVVRLVREAEDELVADELRTSHERFRALADRAPIAIFCSETGLRLAYLNDRSSELFGAPAARLEGMGWLSHVHLEDRPAVIWAMTRALEGDAQELPLRVLRSDGALRSVQARIVPVRDARRDAGFVGTLEDVTERQAFEASLAHQASRDALTGLLNRRRLLELLSEDLVTSRAGGIEPPGLLFLDLDDFKQVNDELGHHAGDALLVEVSRRLREAVRDGDVVSRFGGDEFAVLCRGLHDEADAGDVARRVLAAVTGPVVLGSTTLTVSGSLGVVVAGPTHLEAEDVLRDADIAMYQAKAAGKDRWALFDEQARALARERVELAHDLRRAVELDQLEVHYQPVVRLTEPADRPGLASVEALARWTHERRGPVSPTEFIELAEEHGLVPQLGVQVLRRACAQMVVWQAELGDDAPRTVSVNVSALQLRHGDFAKTVEAVLRETGLSGSSLCLELTETVVMHDEDAVAACFWQLHGLGVRIAIDDFGTGYSSLAVLRRLPFDTLKIDRSLVPDFTTDAYDPVVAAVVGLGHAMGLAVVAEGVETLAQAEGLRLLGCPLAQGHLYGRPMPPEQLARWARQR
jgi:diguanylate cyclase (GGDEF)-like protein/PAS domain S-box-containing protein